MIGSEASIVINCIQLEHCRMYDVQLVWAEHRSYKITSYGNIFTIWILLFDSCRGWQSDASQAIHQIQHKKHHLEASMDAPCDLETPTLSRKS